MTSAQKPPASKWNVLNVPRESGSKASAVSEPVNTNNVWKAGEEAYLARGRK